MNKKILNFLLVIIVILIVIIFSIMYYLFTQDKAEISVYNDIGNYENVNSSAVENKLDEKQAQAEILDVSSEEIQKIFPFTGAFPEVDIIPFWKDAETEVDYLTNEQILRLAWAKVTKDDWADTYVSEAEPVAIKAEVLDKYVKDIFGDIKYEKASFSNTGYSVSIGLEEGNPPTSSYSVEYDERIDRYICTHTAGDGILENRAVIPHIVATKIGDQIKIDVSVAVCTPKEVPLVLEDGTEAGNTFEYIVYDDYNFQTGEVGNEVLKYKAEELNSETAYKEILSTIDANKLNKISFIYKLNPETNAYVLKAIEKN